MDGTTRNPQRRGDRAMTLVEVTVALCLLSVGATALVGTIAVIDARNRYNQRYALAYRAAQQTLATLEASSAINSASDLLLQNGTTFHVDHELFGGPGPAGVVLVTDLSGQWGSTAGVAIGIHVSVDLDGDGRFDDGIDLHGVRVFM